MEIPKALISQIKEGNVVLFLGSGATKEAIHPERKKSPTGQELADLIAAKFLGDDYLGTKLESVSEYAISETSLFTVQRFIADLFSKFEPSESHLLIPTIKWKAIATTNYDLIVEKAYDTCENSLQNLVKFIRDGETVEEKLKTITDVQYFKLHGCINEVNDPKIPLILTTDQYITHKRNRERLFSKVKELAGSNTFLFIGHSLEDSDIRSILLELDNEIANKQRSYIIIPSAKDAQKRLWEGKKVTVIEAKFNEFMKELVKELNGHDFNKDRINIERIKDHSFFSKIDIATKKPSDLFINFIQNDIDFVSANIISENTLPELFYKGIFTNWSPIADNLDINREIKDGILTEVFLSHEEKDLSTYFYLIKGHAGTGKSVLSKRVAWDAAILFEKNCFYLRPNSILRYDIIEELYSFLNERIYLFIDNANQNETEISNLITISKRNKIPISIITTERTNIWNVECSRLQSLLTQSYNLKYLTNKEIESLIKKLDQNNCLGVLKGKSTEVQMQAFEEKAGRELLVALYEATQGRSFQDIVFNEYNEIPDESAKPLYLTVCLMHSIGSSTRAGLLNRVHNVNYTEFKEKFFAPLENLVVARRDYNINDYVYESRHKLIAEFVVSNVLVNEQEKFDEYVKILKNLDVDFGSDKNAFLYLTSGKTLLKNFRDLSKIRMLYSIANKKSIDDPKLMQQEAIFEMNASGGNIKRAEQLLNSANELTEGSDPVILHSLAELKFSFAEKSPTLIEKKKYIRETEDLCKSLLSKRNYTAHPYHTILKAKLLQLQLYLENSELTPVEKLVKEIEKYISLATQAFPEESFIIEANANFNSLIDNAPKAKELLEDAFQQNNKSPYLSTRLASLYENEDDIDKAIETIKTTLNFQPADKDLNYKMAMYLDKKDSNNINDVLFYLKRSFTNGDNRYHAQFWYARALYLNNQQVEALAIFRELKLLNLDPKIKYQPRGVLSELFEGEVSDLSLNNGSIRRNVFGDKIFFFRHNEENDDDLSRNSKVEFRIGFNYCGPIAINVAKK